MPSDFKDITTERLCAMITLESQGDEDQVQEEHNLDEEEREDE